jgi:hypothetical protein
VGLIKLGLLPLLAARLQEVDVPSHLQAEVLHVVLNVARFLFLARRGFVRGWLQDHINRCRGGFVRGYRTTSIVVGEALFGGTGPHQSL